MTFEGIFDGNKILKQDNIDQKKTKKVHLEFNEEDIAIFNEAYQLCLNSDMNTIVRNPSGGIKQGKCFLGNNYAYDVIQTNSCIKLTIIKGAKAICYIVGHSMSTDKEEYPSNVWYKFVEELQKDGIDLDTYRLSPEEGKEIKKQIQSPPQFFYDQYMHETLYNVHHLDYNSSFPAGLCNTHPEFSLTLNRLYERRKEDESYKRMLAVCVSGCMQSPKRPWYSGWSHLCKDARHDNNKRINELAQKLIDSGRVIIGYNTDGIWYQGDIYHDENEGTALGQWKNDHVNCKFRAKSNGAYEFIEKGEYHPVLRGCTKLDAIKPRDQWKWGDIYAHEATNYEFDRKRGLVCITQKNGGNKNI